MVEKKELMRITEGVVLVLVLFLVVVFFFGLICSVSLLVWSLVLGLFLFVFFFHSLSVKFIETLGRANVPIQMISRYGVEQGGTICSQSTRKRRK